MTYVWLFTVSCTYISCNTWNKMCEEKNIHFVLTWVQICREFLYAKPVGMNRSTLQDNGDVGSPKDGIQTSSGYFCCPPPLTLSTASLRDINTQVSVFGDTFSPKYVEEPLSSCYTNRTCEALMKSIEQFHQQGDTRMYISQFRNFYYIIKSDYKMPETVILSLVYTHVCSE